MILLENLVVAAFKAANLKLSTTESLDWKDDYVTYARTGGDGLDRTDREDIVFDFIVYSTDRPRALRLGYEALKTCKGLEDSYYQISNLVLGPLVQGPIVNKQYTYTFAITATVYNPL